MTTKREYRELAKQNLDWYQESDKALRESVQENRALEEVNADLERDLKLRIALNDTERTRGDIATKRSVDQEATVARALRANRDLAAAVAAANEHAELHATNEETLLAFLDDLLILEPSLERFTIDGDGTADDWDFSGAAIAAAHVTGAALAEEYAA